MNYQLTLLIKKELEDKERKELLDSVTKTFGQKIIEDLWGNRELSYPIKKQTSAYYAHFEFEAEPRVISSLDKSLRLNEDIIRYLLIKRD